MLITRETSLDRMTRRETSALLAVVEIMSYKDLIIHRPTRKLINLTTFLEMPQQHRVLITSIAIIIQIFSIDKAALAAIGSTNIRSKQQPTCTFEIENANRTVTNWPVIVRKMITESELDKPVQTEMVRELNKIQLLVDKFSSNINKRPIESLVKDLVGLRRASNRLALSVYLKTFDMRLPQTSVQFGVAVERVQQACLSNVDRAAMLVLNSPIGLLTKSSLGFLF